MDIQKIKELALANGFKLKEQASGNLDLNAYVYDFANAIEREAKAQAVPEWISVEDRLPDDSYGRVLAWVVEQNSLGKCGFAWNCSHSNGVFSDKFETFQVTHWMPLPEPPTKECK